MNSFGAGGLATNGIEFGRPTMHFTDRIVKRAPTRFYDPRRQGVRAAWIVT